MPDLERIQRGRDFELYVAEVLGARAVPGSGNGWRQKGDTRNQLLTSCKAEATKSWNRVREQLREAIDMAFGTGASPVLVILDDDDEAIVAMRLSDFAKALDGAPINAQRGRGEMQRERVAVPALLRE